MPKPLAPLPAPPELWEVTARLEQHYQQHNQQHKGAGPALPRRPAEPLDTVVILIPIESSSFGFNPSGGE